MAASDGKGAQRKSWRGKGGSEFRCPTGGDNAEKTFEKRGELPQ